MRTGKNRKVIIPRNRFFLYALLSLFLIVFLLWRSDGVFKELSSQPAQDLLTASAQLDTSLPTIRITGQIKPETLQSLSKGTKLLKVDLQRRKDNVPQATGRVTVKIIDAAVVPPPPVVGAACLKLSLENVAVRGGRGHRHDSVKVIVKDQAGLKIAEETLASNEEGQINQFSETIRQAMQGSNVRVVIKPNGYTARTITNPASLFAGCLATAPFFAGDTNGDGRIDREDIMAVIRSYKQTTVDSKITEIFGDRIKDLRLMVRVVVGMIKAWLGAKPGEGIDDD